MKTPEYNDLYHLYWNERQPLKEIAARFGVTIPAIRQKMQRLGIPRRSNSEAQKLGNGTDALTDEVLRQMYLDEGLSQAQIAQHFGLTQTAIGLKLRAAGVPMRSKVNAGSKNGMYGRTHTPEAREKIRAAQKRQFATEEARARHGVLTARQIADGRTGKAYNALETKFAAILDRLGIAYKQQHRLGRFVYDFYVPALHALVEVHGTFWHADPRFYRPDNLSAIQHRNLANDRRKAERAAQDGYALLVFWEHDIDRISL